MAFTQPVAFTPVEEELILAFAQQATLAIQLTQLSEEAKQIAIAREQEKAAQAWAMELAKTNQALQSSLDKLADEPDLHKSLGHILIVCAEQFGAIGTGIWQYEGELSYLLVSYEAGTIHLPLELAHADVPRALRQMREDPDIYNRLACGEVVIQTEEDLQTRSIYQPYQAELEAGGIQSLLLIPICIGQSLRGSLVLRFDRPYTLKQEAAGLAHALANQAALALELTRLAEEAQQATLLEERNRMARELHDILAQSLTGIIMHQEAIRQQSSCLPTIEREIQDHINWTLTLAREGLQTARRSVHALRSDTTQLKLQNALETLADRMTRNFPIEAIVSVRGASYPLSNEVANHLLRVGQEALTNTIKHAAADRVHIELIFEPTQVRLRIQDNGQGFIAKPAASSGFGLLGMQERAERLGGYLTITSQPAKGTEVAIAVPSP
jgi:signal transduction histidine kinase